jgi:hypothetical protein
MSRRRKKRVQSCAAVQLRDRLRKRGGVAGRAGRAMRLIALRRRFFPRFRLFDMSPSV